MLIPHINTVTREMLDAWDDSIFFQSLDLMLCTGNDRVAITPVSPNICDWIEIIEIDVHDRRKGPIAPHRIGFLACNHPKIIRMLQVFCCGNTHLSRKISAIRADAIPATLQVCSQQQGNS